MSELNWWLIVQTPAGVWAWDCGEDYEAAIDMELHNAARVIGGFVEHDDPRRWIDEGYDIQLSRGTPHPTLLRRATVGTAADLAAVDRDAVGRHAAGRAEFYRGQRLAAAVDALGALDAQGRQELAAILNAGGPGGPGGARE